MMIVLYVKKPSFYTYLWEKTEKCFQKVPFVGVWQGDEKKNFSNIRNMNKVKMEGANFDRVEDKL